MASAVLASRNEPSWGQSSGGLMGKLPYSNHLNPNPNTNSNSNSVPKKKQFHSISGQVNGRDSDSQPVTQATSDDAHSFNQRSMYSNGRADFNHGDYISFNISSYTRTELVELKKRLVSELELIRSLSDRIESGAFQPRSHGEPQFLGKSKKHSGKKRPLPFVSGKDQKRVCEKPGNVFGANEIGDLMKKCRLMLTTLMKHKHSWVFKEPVDAVAMGLHDYHQIVKHPMDLGSVKSKFAKNLYESPLGFAEDVRLTFNNAILYNPKTDKVHEWAKELLDRFEDLFRPIQEKLDGHQREQRQTAGINVEFQRNSWNHIPIPEIERTKKSASNSMLQTTSKKHEKAQMPQTTSKPSSSSQQLVQSPPRMSSPMRALPVKPAVVKANLGKLPKPKAKDPDKREMSMEEKDRLSIGLQDLPQGKMPQLIQIIRKRNAHLAQEEDEIEIEIASLDTETLWELDRFLTNWKKMVSKTKRQALMANNLNSAAATVTASASVSAEDNMVSACEKAETLKKPKKGDAGEEDVDIGDEMPTSSFPRVEIEKDEGGRDHVHATSSSSSSSSSGSDSSSSSDSDSASSSGSDSDADDAQSRGLESKEFSKMREK